MELLNTKKAPDSLVLWAGWFVVQTVRRGGANGPRVNIIC
jgi:hypothetical protein